MTTEQPKPRKLLDCVRDMLRVKHYSIHTEKTYVSWIISQRRACSCQGEVPEYLRFAFLIAPGEDRPTLLSQGGEVSVEGSWGNAQSLGQVLDSGGTTLDSGLSEDATQASPPQVLAT